MSITGIINKDVKIAVKPNVNHPIENELVRSRVSPKRNGPKTHPEIVIKFKKPVAVPRM